MRYKLFLIAAGVLVILIYSCKPDYTPKPRGYFRIDFPEKEYRRFISDCPYTFEYPVYGEIERVDDNTSHPCWLNIIFPGFKGKIYLTYKRVEQNLPEYTEDIRTIAYKHLVKADDIIEKRIIYPEHDVYGILYNIKGNTASSLNFYVTDSITHFLSGSLYFEVKPNADSLAPVINYFTEDVNHLIKTIEWN